MNYLFTSIILLSSIYSFAQERITATFGEPTQEEYDLTVYKDDPDVAAVVLFESGNIKVDIVGDRTTLIENVHRKIKVLDAKKFENGEIQIEMYQHKNDKERIKDIKAITHNGKRKQFVSKDAIFEVDLTENWKAKRFAFPDIKDGSILEYTYRKESPYFSNLDGWNVQGDLPKLYSEFRTEIPGNFFYDKALFGTIKPVHKEATLKKRCLYVSGYEKPADCEVTLLVFKDIPVFKPEDYMLSEKNYISRVSYELREMVDFQGISHKYSTTWKDVDKKLKYDKDLGRQLNNKSFFKSKISEDILTTTDLLEKAKKIYTFVQEHYTWNKKYRTFGNIRVKRAWEKKNGNNSEINLSLINLLKAAGFDAKMVFASTRTNGIPTPVYPVITDFNYVFVALHIGEQRYLLDATRKNIPFGMLPFELLNGRARMLDLKKGSEWIDVIPADQNIYNINTQLTANKEGGFTGNVKEICKGYIALQTRNYIQEKSIYIYKKQKKDNHTTGEISDIEIENLINIEKTLNTKYKVVLEPEIIGNKLYLNPFFFKTFFTENPFSLKERNYPINFGFKIRNTYSVQMDLNDQYKIVDLPESKAFKLPDNQGECHLYFNESNGKINIRLNIKLNNIEYAPENYNTLKLYFENIIKVQTQSFITLEKT